MVSIRIQKRLSLQKTNPNAMATPNNNSIYKRNFLLVRNTRIRRRSKGRKVIKKTRTLPIQRSNRMAHGMDSNLGNPRKPPRRNRSLRRWFRTLHKTIYLLHRLVHNPNRKTRRLKNFLLKPSTMGNNFHNRNNHTGLESNNNLIKNTKPKKKIRENPHTPTKFKINKREYRRCPFKSVHIRLGPFIKKSLSQFRK